MVLFIFSFLLPFKKMNFLDGDIIARLDTGEGRERACGTKIRARLKRSGHSVSHFGTTRDVHMYFYKFRPP